MTAALSNLNISLTTFTILVGIGLSAGSFADTPRQEPKTASLRFFGSKGADTFTRVISESFQGVLAKDFIEQPDGSLPVGYVQASPTGQPWGGTMWTRDGGTFMRELVQWGYIDQAVLLSDCLIKLVEKNKEGYYSFPEYFDGAKPGSGMELDGTASIIIGMEALWERLPKNSEARKKISAFLNGSASPVEFLCYRLKGKELVAGTGEFGPGCGLPGEAVNVVQNGLIVDALEAMVKMSNVSGDKKAVRRYQELAHRVTDAMIANLVDGEGKWLWCIDPKTMKPDPAIVNHEINRGFGGLNGVTSMRADVCGFEPVSSRDVFVAASSKTLESLYRFPLRKQQYDKYGIWTQFDVFRGGLASSVSYGQSYALQTMLLLDQLELADRGVNWIGTATVDLVPGYNPPRESRFHIVERMYSPDAVGKVDLEAGCGALNLVNVTEALKVSRLMLGVDDTSSKVTRLVPRLLPSWKGMEAKNWPILTSGRLVHADIRVERIGRGMTLKVKVLDGVLPRVAVRLPSSKGYVRFDRRNIRELDLKTE